MKPDQKKEFEADKLNLQTVIDIVSSQHEIVRMRLVGSRARGISKTDSDWDLLIEFPTFNSYSKHLNRVRDTITRKLDRKNIPIGTRNAINFRFTSTEVLQNPDAELAFLYESMLMGSQILFER